MITQRLRLISPTRLEANGKQYVCRIGRGGIAAPGTKREGDLKTPRGLFALRPGYFRADRLTEPSSALAFSVLSENDGWCDDPTDVAYNRPVKLPYAARHECLWREDSIYDVIVPLGYNDGIAADGSLMPIIPGAGSAIFLHVMRDDGVGTEGCIALALPDLLEVLKECSSATQMEVVYESVR